MKNILIILFLSVSTVLLSQEHTIKTQEATVSFNFFSKETTGTIKNVSATISINKKALSKSVVRGSANVTSLSTENEGRDSHLMNADFFDAEKYPTMIFQSTGLEIIENELIAKGSLTIKEVSKEIMFVVTEEEGSLVFTSMIYSSDFDINVKKEREDNKIEVKVFVPFSK
tara:strand:- start:8553 stop:9065 length:513 start_codon:yes stop_codon:yes gene_type:complete